MTRKDYVAIAKVINNIDLEASPYAVSNDYPVWATLNLVIDGLVEVMKADNPNFNPAQFREACGYDYEIVEVN